MTVLSSVIRSVSLAAWTAAWLAPPVFAQTTLDLARQARNVDFSQSTRTRPIKTGINLPATCQTGDLFFKVDSSPTQNLHACLDPGDNWVALTGTAIAVTSSLQLNDMRVVRTSPQVLTLNQPCLSGSPCNYRIGSVVRSVTQPSTLTVASNSGPGNAYIYLDTEGVKVGLDGQLSATCTGGCTVLPQSSPEFPAGSIPLFVWASSTTSGQWDSTGQDLRGLLMVSPVEVGPGLARVTTNAGSTRIELDNTTLPRYRAGSGAPAGPCQPGLDLYLDSVTGGLWVCTAVDTWRQPALLARSAGVYSSAPVCSTAAEAGLSYQATDGPGYAGLCGGTGGWSWWLGPTAVTPPLAAAQWTAANGAALADGGGAVSWAAAANGGVQAMLRPVPASTPYTITYGVMPQAHGSGAACGALWTSGTTAAAKAHTVSLTEAAALRVTQWTDLSTADTDDLAARPVLGAGPRVFFRLTDDGTNRVFAYSGDGVRFQTLATVARATPFTPTHAGVYCQGPSGAPFQGLLIHAGGQN